jgi:hypothetical protein
MIDCSKVEYFFIDSYYYSDEIEDNLVKKLGMKSVARLSDIHFAKKADAEKFAELVLRERAIKFSDYSQSDIDTLDFNVVEKFEKFIESRDGLVLKDSHLSDELGGSADYFHQEWNGEEITSYIDGDRVYLERKVKSKIKDKIKAYSIREIDGETYYKEVLADYTNEWFDSNPWQTWLIVCQGHLNLYEYR